MVTRKDVFNTLKELGVDNGDVLLFHSSLKSFGQVENGADDVIDGALDAVGKDGTLVAPTLVQKDFSNAYKNWNKLTSPSDVGLITETFRKRQNAIRSDQATHSVSAIGKMAEFLTNSHSTSKPRIFPYGDYAFSHGSPWQKMYDINARVVMVGAPDDTITFRHFVEAIYAENLIEAVKDDEYKKNLYSRLVTYSNITEYKGIMRETGDPYATDLIRFQFGNKESQTLDDNIVKSAYCGNSLFKLFFVKDYVDGMLEKIDSDPAKYFTKRVAELIFELKSLAK
jgi:aminoglycoside 3-N-acetyltransferase